MSNQNELNLRVKMVKYRALVIAILFSVLFQVSAQFTYPDASKLELLGKSDNIVNCKLFCNELCNVFLFSENNVICSVAGALDSLPLVARVSEAGECKNAFLAGGNLIVQRKKEIVSISQDMNSISKSVDEMPLYEYGNRDIDIFYSNSSGFFIVEHKINKKTKITISRLSYFNLTEGSLNPILEVEGRINCITGDTSVMCLGVDTNLVVIASRTVGILCTEEDDIITVAPSLAGVFYSTHSSVNFISDDFQKITIAKQGARQLIDNCNTLYMILEDGSLLRLLNSAAFTQLNNNSQENPDDDN